MLFRQNQFQFPQASKSINSVSTLQPGSGYRLRGILLFLLCLLIVHFSLQFKTDAAISEFGSQRIRTEVANPPPVTSSPPDRINTSSPASLDPDFSPMLESPATVLGLVVQNDGKFVIGGDFSQVNGVSQNRIARLNRDGSLDPDFQSGMGADSFVNDVEGQPDGKIMIGGGFTAINGMIRSRIARLNADGSVDASFNPGAGPNASIFRLSIQPDRKVLISASTLTSVNGIPRNGLARLNEDGSLDPGFNPGTGPNNTVFALLAKADGKVLAGGSFTSFNGVARNGFVQLNPDGGVDTSFVPGTNGGVFAILNQPDGTILIGGGFSTVGGVARARIARLNPNGSLDTSFTPGSGANSSVFDLALQPDGKIILFGPFTTFNGIPRNHVARLNSNGSLDMTFDPGNGIDGIFDIGVQSDGNIVIGGSFITLNEARHLGLGLLRPNGNVDEGFTAQVETPPTVSAITVQTDGKILAGGLFNKVNGQSLSNLVRLNPDGTIDKGFNSGTGPNSAISALGLQQDGQILLGGGQTTFNGVSSRFISRIGSDGSLDPTFRTGTGPDNSVLDLKLQSDGKIIIGGLFTSVGGTSMGRIARLNPNGSLDFGFTSGSGFDGQVSVILLQPDGKIVVGGFFSRFNGIERPWLARLHANGALDEGFQPPLNGRALGLELQPDGKLLVGGLFTVLGYSNLIRINPDGTIDTTFKTGMGTDQLVTEIKLESDGKILIGGRFTEVNGKRSNRIARLLRDGSLDLSFQAGSGADNFVQSLFLQADGKIILGGGFASFDGIKQPGIARLQGGGAQTPQVSILTPKSGEALSSGSPTDILWTSTSEAALESHTVALSTDGGSAFGTILATGLPAAARKFTWMIPTNLATETGRIQVTARDINGVVGIGVSDTFGVRAPQAPKVTVLSPPAGASLTSGTMVSITWTTTASAMVTGNDILLSTDGGATFTTTVSSNVPGTAQSFSWAIPGGLETPQARIQVSAKDVNGLSGQGISGLFGIRRQSQPDTTAPTVTNVSLSKKKVIRKTDPILVITWNARDDQGVSSQNLVFAGDGEQFSTEVVSGLPGTTSLFSWSIPPTLAKSNSGKVKVIARDLAGNSGEATSSVVKIK